MADTRQFMLVLIAENSYLNTSFYEFVMYHCSRGTCSHTKIRECPANKKAWWKIEFSTEVQIDWISIWNRDKDKERSQKRIDAVKV